MSRGQRGAALLLVMWLILLLSGIWAYGCWFMTAHSLQQAANDAARASVAGKYRATVVPAPGVVVSSPHIWRMGSLPRTMPGSPG